MILSHGHPDKGLLLVLDEGKENCCFLLEIYIAFFFFIFFYQNVSEKQFLFQTNFYTWTYFLDTKSPYQPSFFSPNRIFDKNSWLLLPIVFNFL